MDKKAVFGLVVNESQANHIVEQLLNSGFHNEDISILYPNKNVSRTENYDKKVRRGGLNTEKHTKAPEGGVTGVTAGGILGGSLGLLAGIGALSIPGLGPFIAAGPIMATLSGTAVGGTLGLILGAIFGSAYPEYETVYENGLKQGNILLSVHTDNQEELKRAKDILKNSGATDVCCACEEKAKH